MKKSLRIVVTLSAVCFCLFSTAHATDHGFVISGGYHSIDYPGSAWTRAFDNNFSGQIVGTYGTNSSQQTSHAFMKDGDTYTSFDYGGHPQTYAVGINWNGQIAGYSVDGSFRYGFLKDGDTFTSIQFPGSTSTRAYGINGSGRIVGSYGDDYGTGPGSLHAFLEVDGAYTSFDYPGAIKTEFFGIADGNPYTGLGWGTGLIAGSYYTGTWHGFVTNHGVPSLPEYIAIDFPGAINTRVFGINSTGMTIVGSYYGSDYVSHGFRMLYDRETMSWTSPLTIDFPDATRTIAFGVDHGIVGYYSAPDRVPEPGVLLGLAPALAGLVVMRKRLKIQSLEKQQGDRGSLLPSDK